MFEEIIEKLNRGSRLVFFTGAGISTDSGIPDFRSKSGLYNQGSYMGHSPEEILSISFFRENPDVFYRYYSERILCPNSGPNEGHKAIARIEALGLHVTVITQNIDGFHTSAGSSHVLELHGSVLKNHCVGCRKKYGIDFIQKAAGEIPVCPYCGEIVRPEIVMYGELLDEDVFKTAADSVRDADFLFAVGSSLAVYPAAGLLNHFRHRTFYIINLGDTPYDTMAAMRYEANSSFALTMLSKEIENGLL